MATTITQGNELYIPFIDGKSISNSQNVPRIYQSVGAFKRNFPKHDLGTEGLVLQKYIPEQHGRWVRANDEQAYFDVEYICSACQFVVAVSGIGTPSLYGYHHCPNCGAKMDGGDNNGSNS